MMSYTNILRLKLFSWDTCDRCDKILIRYYVALLHIEMHASMTHLIINMSKSLLHYNLHPPQLWFL